MATATFSFKPSILNHLRKSIPKRKMSTFVQGAVERELILRDRCEVLKKAKEMSKWAKKYHMGGSEDTVRMIREFRDKSANKYL